MLPHVTGSRFGAGIVSNHQSGLKLQSAAVTSVKLFSRPGMSKGKSPPIRATPTAAEGTASATAAGALSGLTTLDPAVLEILQAAVQRGVTAALSSSASGSARQRKEYRLAALPPLRPQVSSVHTIGEHTAAAESGRPTRAW